VSKIIYNVKVEIAGFADLHEVYLEAIDDVFCKMMDNETGNSVFILINPFVLRDYDFELGSDIKAILGIRDDSKVNVYNVVLANSDITKTTINFLSPLVFHDKTKSVAQTTLDHKEYPSYGMMEKISDYLNKN
jgi:flagellar assembly factor FliW